MTNANHAVYFQTRAKPVTTLCPSCAEQVPKLHGPYRNYAAERAQCAHCKGAILSMCEASKLNV